MSKKRSQVSRRFWVVIGVAVIIVSAIAGIYSAGQSPMGTIDTFYGSPRKARSYTDAPDFYTGAEDFDLEEWETKRIRSLEKVTKIIEVGVIQRINEPNRKLYINDPVWKVMKKDRQEHVARVVAEYLDVINNRQTGMVDVFSFRSGRRIAEINSVGTFSKF